MFGLQLGRARGSSEDVDCLVCLASGGFFVLEIKTGFGRVSVLQDGAVRAGQRVLPGDPVAQARRARADADRLLRSASCEAMVVISDGCGAPVWSNGVLVCAPHDAVARMRGSGTPTEGEVAALGRARSVARRQRKRVTGR